MLDICAGKKTVSQVFLNRGWKVLTLDNDPQFEPVILADVRSWSYTGERPDFIWCSPPCDEFAREFMPWSRTGKTPDLSILLACVRIIRQANPRYWAVENVKGSLNWFRPILGEPTYVCNPYFLWGNFPSIAHIRVKSRKEHFTSSRSIERAAIPPTITNALAFSIENSPMLPFDPYPYGVGQKAP